MRDAMTEKEMIIHVLKRLDHAIEEALILIDSDQIKDNENPKFSIPKRYTMRIGEFLVTDEKTQLFGDIATANCQKLTV